MTQILLFYKYVTIEDPAQLREEVEVLARGLELTGRVLIAEEGINGTLEGSHEHTEAFMTEILKDARLRDMNVKRSEGTGDAFPKLSVKVRQEIVSTRFPAHIDPRVRTAPHLPAEQMHAWYKENKDFVVIDMRNDYEFKSGHFKNSVNPGMDASRELPEVMPKLEAYKDKTVVTVCTGGVRCEKMSAFLLDQGFSDVYQLENGMHTYMEQYPGEDFLGALYTFDNRKTMHFGGEREIVGRCHHCEAPTEEYVNCGNDFCHHHFLVCTNCKGEERTFCSSDCREKVTSMTESRHG